MLPLTSFPRTRALPQFLIGRDGQPLQRYKPGFDPLEFEGDVSGPARRRGGGTRDVSMRALQEHAPRSGQQLD